MSERPSATRNGVSEAPCILAAFGDLWTALSALFRSWRCTKFLRPREKGFPEDGRNAKRFKRIPHWNLCRKIVRTSAGAGVHDLFIELQKRHGDYSERTWDTRNRSTAETKKKKRFNSKLLSFSNCECQEITDVFIGSNTGGKIILRRRIEYQTRMKRHVHRAKKFER